MPRKIIGICGFPGHGKTTVQNILVDVGVVGIDDSRPLRKLAMKKYNLTENQVGTQAGKSELVLVDGEYVEVRKLIGDLGKEHEEAYGNNWWIDQAIKKHVDEADPKLTSPISFGSMRMGQGWPVRASGGIVVAIHNPRVKISTHDFDQYDASCVDHFIWNDGTVEDLRRNVLNAVQGYLDQ